MAPFTPEHNRITGRIVGFFLRFWNHNKTCNALAVLLFLNGTPKDSAIFLSRVTKGSWATLICCTCTFVMRPLYIKSFGQHLMIHGGLANMSTDCAAIVAWQKTRENKQCQTRLAQCQDLVHELLSGAEGGPFKMNGVVPKTHQKMCKYTWLGSGAQV